MSLIDQVRLAGVVGIPAHVKLGSSAEIIIANGAECEPLLHKDAAVMEQYAAGGARRGAVHGVDRRDGWRDRH